jgi:hypothetical protein
MPIATDGTTAPSIRNGLDLTAEVAEMDQVRRLRTLFCSNAMQLSMAALSPAAPTRPIEPVRP